MPFYFKGLKACPFILKGLKHALLSVGTWYKGMLLNFLEKCDSLIRGMPLYPSLPDKRACPFKWEFTAYIDKNLNMNKRLKFLILILVF